MCDKDEDEKNFGAEAQNWEQRVERENNAARIWDKNWASLYNPNLNGQGHDYEKKIKALENEMKEISLPRMATVSNTSYKAVQGYKEWQDHRRRSQDRIQDCLNEEDQEDQNMNT
jgi:hypothetical protein|eukprot:scaffold4487_cov273-Chaetoceros_neogracile.AAC.13